MTLQIGFCGLSHLGLVSSIAAAKKGFKITGFDEDASVIDLLNSGKLPLHEPDLDETFHANRDRLSFTKDIKDLTKCDVIYISRDVPTDRNNISDASPIERLLQKLSDLGHTRATYVILSQVSPGFTRRLSEIHKNLKLYYQVETLIFGRALERALLPERYIVGCAQSGQEISPPLMTFLKAHDCPILPMRYESAELAKISINFFLVSSVSTSNTLAEVCEKIGAEWNEIAPALKLDRRIGPYAYLAPGLGIAGGNLERDLQTVLHLGSVHGTDTRVVNSWIANCDYRKDWALRSLHENFLKTDVKPQKIAVWGVAYKIDTNSTKNSPSISLISALNGLPVTCYDPQAVLPQELKDRGVRQESTALKALENADVLVIMTPWKEFSSVSADVIAKNLKNKIVIDPFGVLNAKDCQVNGIKRYTLGSGTKGDAQTC